VGLFFAGRADRNVRRCRMSREDTWDDYAVRAAVEVQARMSDSDSIASELTPELSYSDNDLECIRVLNYLTDQHLDDETADAIAIGLYEYSVHGKLPPGFKTRVQ
jgi:hypothetical protein